MISLSRPLKSNRLNQGFGANGSCIEPDTRKVITKTGLTCPIPYVDFYLFIGMKGHNGEDFAAWRGEPIYFNAIVYGGGIIEGVAKNEIDKDGGKGVDILFKDPVTQRNFKTRYWHLQNSAVYDGQIVRSGDVIGYADSTGASSGDHLHWSLKPTLPDGSNAYPDNGFVGAVNIRDFDGVKYYPDDFILTTLNLFQQLSLLEKIIKLYSLLIKK